MSYCFFSQRYIFRHLQEIYNVLANACTLTHHILNKLQITKMSCNRIYWVKLLESLQFSCKGVQQHCSSTYATKLSLISTKTHPVDALRQTLNPHSILEHSHHNTCPALFRLSSMTISHSFLSSLSPSILPPSPPPFCCFACHPNMEALLNDTQISSFAGISCYILTVDIPEEEGEKNPSLFEKVDKALTI